MRARFVVGYVAFSVACLAAYPLVPHSGAGYDIWYQAFSVAAVVGIAVGVFRNRPAATGAWLLIGAGQALFAGGDAIYLAYDASGANIPYPSVADATYLGAYPLIAAGLLVMLRRSTPGRDWSSLIDAGIVTTAAAVASWVFLMEPYTRDSSQTLSQKIVSIAYPMMDVLLLAVVARMLLMGGRRSPAYGFLAGAIVLQLTGDVLYGAGQLNGFYSNGSALDLPLAGAYLLFGLAALHPSMVGLTKPTSDPERRLTRRRLVLLALASFMAPAMLAIGSVRSHDLALFAAVGGSVILSGLVIARLAGLVARHERAVLREHALRRAASDLVAAPDREAIYEVALGAVHSLAGDRSCRTELSMGVHGDRELVAARGSEPSAAARADVFPLMIEGEERGDILIRTERPFSQQGRESIETLSAQVALALESARLTEDLLERQSAERFRSLVQNSTDLIAVLEPDLTIRFTTPSVGSVLGYGEDELVGRNLSELLQPEELGGIHDLYRRLASQMGGHSRRALRLRRKDGSWCDAESVSTNLVDDPNIHGFVLTVRDVTEQKALEQELSHQAFHDSLTGLANRALYLDRLEHALDRRPRRNQRVTIVFVDLDDFKAINDTRGHTAGDELLTIVSERLQHCVRPSDTCARLGGDEFAVLIEDSSGPDNAREVAQRILDAVTGTPAPIDGALIQLHLTAGVAAQEPGQTASELLRDADIALHEAKRLGKNRYQLFEPALREQLLERTELQEQLRDALERDELEVHYQPIIELTSGAIAAFEALARWQHPNLGFVPPDRFIPLAEESGLILRLGTFVLEQACLTTRRWRQTVPGAEKLRVNVNISGHQLATESLQGDVQKALNESGLAASDLTLEITETVLMADREQAIARLRELRALGVRVALDDFGTGYSSLEYLWNFPIDVLKIDKSFVGDLGRTTGRSRLSAAIIRLGATRGVETVAEGIEEAQQLEHLRRLKCGYGQGYHFSRPLPATAAETFLRANAAEAGSRRAVATAR